MTGMMPCPGCGDTKHDYDEVDEQGCVNCTPVCVGPLVGTASDHFTHCERCSYQGSQLPHSEEPPLKRPIKIMVRP